MTYGYITKNTCIKNDLPKGHRIDALCISGNPTVKKMRIGIILRKLDVIIDKFTKLIY